MSFVYSTPDLGGMSIADESAHALPNATTNLTERLLNLRPDPAKEKKYATFLVVYPSSLAGNLTAELVGRLTVGGPEVTLATLKSASSTAGNFSAVVDLNSVPALEYYVRFTAVGNESSRTARVTVCS